MPNTIRLGNCEIDLRLFELRRGGQVVPIERRVFDLIAYLLQNRGRIVPNDELFRVLWKGRAVSKGSLTVAVAAARRALGDNAKRAQVIITHRGRGYRLHTEVEDCQKEPLGRDATISTSFVGRDFELSALTDLLSSRGGSRARFACILGEPGIGKSRLTEEFASIACDMGALVAVGRCREEEGAPSFWPWGQIAKQLCEGEVNRDAAQMLACDAPEIAAWVPGLRSASESASNVLPPANARFRLFDSFARFLRRASAGRVLVLVLDDIHRADMSTLLLLDFVLHDLQEEHMLVLATYRRLELESEQGRLDLVSTISRRVDGITLALEGLGSSDIAKLIRRATGRTPSPEQTDAIGNLTNGNPFFLWQLLPFLPSDPEATGRVAGALPRTVRDTVVRQVDALSSDGRKLLRVAAVVGREFEGWLVQRAVGWNSNRVCTALREASSGGVVTRIGGDRERWRFSHALVRDVLYEGLDDTEHAQLHAAIGEVLDGFEPMRRERLPEIAYHFGEAIAVCGAERAIDLACEAGRAASDGLAYEEASVHFGRALRIAEGAWSEGFERHCAILLRMGTEQLRAGDRAAARQTFERAARVADSISAPGLLAEAAIGAAPGFFAVEAGVPDEFLVSVLRRALASLDTGEDQWRALVMARLAAALFWSEDGQECIAQSRHAAALVRGAWDPAIRLQVILARWLAEWTPYEVDARRELATEAVGIARGIGSKEALAVSLLHQCVGELECGEMSAFDRSAAEFRVLARDLKQPQPLWYGHLLDAARALHTGRFLRAEESMARCVEIGRRIGDANVFLSKMAQSIIHAAERGAGAEVVAISEAASNRYPVFIGWRASRCWGLALSGEARAASRELDELLAEVSGRAHRRLDWPTALVAMSESAVLLGRADAAEVLRGLLLPLEGRVLVLGFCVMTWGPVARYLGMLSETMGLYSEAEAWYGRSIEEGARCEGEPWLAHSEAGLARVWRRNGRAPSEIEALRGKARARAAKLGMAHLHQRIASG